MIAAVAVVIDLSRFGIGPFNRLYMRLMDPLLKSDEAARMTGATHMLIAATLVFWLFGRDVGIPVMFYLSLGDPVAAIVGSRVPGPRLMGKSPGGTLAFAATGAAIAGVLVATGAVQYHWAMWPGAVIAALVELAGIPPDDNLTIPPIAGATMWAMGA
jgi:dolichol kinase